MTDRPGEPTRAALIKRIEVGDHTVAAELSRLLARDELPHALAVECVPHAWRWNNHPLADLPQYRWIELLRFAGYTHEYEPATRPIGRAERLWRGSSSPDRMSWTTDRTLARGFAIRNAGLDSTDGNLDEPPVWLAIVDPARLLAYLSLEQEYVIDPLGLAAEQIR